MARIIRLTESDLSRIVRRVINEEQEAQKQQLESKMKSCWDSNKYSGLNDLMIAYGLGLGALGAGVVTVMAAAVPGGGIMGGLTATAALLMGANATDKWVTAIKNTPALKREARDLAKCLTGY